MADELNYTPVDPQGIQQSIAGGPLASVPPPVTTPNSIQSSIGGLGPDANVSVPFDQSAADSNPNGTFGWARQAGTQQYGYGSPSTQTYQQRMQAQMTPEQRAAQAKFAPPSAISSAPVLPSGPVGDNGLPTVVPQGYVTPPPSAPPVQVAPPVVKAAEETKAKPAEAKPNTGLGSGAPGEPFDPYATQRGVLGAAEGRLFPYGAESAEAVRNRIAAEEGMRGENTSYAKQIQDSIAKSNAQRDVLEKNRSDLIKSEAARNYTDDYWNSRALGGTGSRIAGALAKAAGGFLQGWNRLGSNPAVDEINANIAHYTQNARAQSQMKIGEQDTLYNHFLQKTGSDQQAIALTHGALLDSASEKLTAARDAEKDVDKKKAIQDTLGQLHLQDAMWTDQNRTASHRAAQGSSVGQLLDMQQKVANTAKTEAETKKVEAETLEKLHSLSAAGDNGATQALSNFYRAKAENGGEDPAGGVIGFLARQNGAVGAVGRVVGGSDVIQANANHDDLARAWFRATYPQNKRVPSPEQIKDIRRDQGIDADPVGFARKLQSMHPEAIRSSIAGDNTPSSFESSGSE